MRLVNKFKQILGHGDVQYFVGSGKFKFYKTVLVVGLNFLVSWYLTQVTDKEFFGEYQYFLSILALLNIFALPGMQDAIVQSVARGFKSSLTIGTRIKFKYSLWGYIPIGGLIAYYTFITPDSALALAFTISLIFFPFFYAFRSFFAYLNGVEKFKEEFHAHSLIEVVKAGSLILIVFLFHENLTALVVAFFVSQTTLFTYYYFSVKRRLAHGGKGKKDPGLKKYSCYLSKIDAIGIAVSYFDKFITGLLLGPEILAIYVVGIMLPAKARTFTMPLMSVFFPRFSSNRLSLTKKKIVMILGVSAGLVLVLMLVTPFFLRIFFPDYVDSTIYGILYSLIALFLPLNVIFEYFFKAKKNSVAIRNTLIIPRIINIAMTIPMLIYFQLYGLIATQIIMQAIMMTLNLKYYRNFSIKNAKN